MDILKHTKTLFGKIKKDLKKKGRKKRDRQ